MATRPETGGNKPPQDRFSQRDSEHFGWIVRDQLAKSKLPTPPIVADIARVISKGQERQEPKPRGNVFFVHDDGIIEPRSSVDDHPPGWFTKPTTPPRVQREIEQVRHDPDHATSKSGKRQIKKVSKATNGGRSPQYKASRR